MIGLLGWVDNVILVMVLFGIVIIIVVVICVGGLFWMKRIIGRSWELMVSVEMELMFLILLDVSELWNG